MAPVIDLWASHLCRDFRQYLNCRLPRCVARTTKFALDRSLSIAVFPTRTTWQQLLVEYKHRQSTRKRVLSPKFIGYHFWGNVLIFVSSLARTSPLPAPPPPIAGSPRHRYEDLSGSEPSRERCAVNGAPRTPRFHAGRIGAILPIISPRPARTR
jgi:hypothetical protein